ncbi:MAG: hypothetical protein CMO20_03535, partial [Thermoplasmata archaeon]|nr:hypothetical protein [Thermoplasmata archaeon]
MNGNTYRAALLSLVLILSSLAGCLGGDEEQDGNEAIGKVMVSTYHVGELVSAVAGDTLDVEIISPSNVPVHDYEPSAGDIIRLQDSDLFLYHGLNLEPWVESTLASLGSDAPVSAMTHTMPSGETSLDYESILIADLCELITAGPYEGTVLGLGGDHDEHDDHDDHHETEEDAGHHHHGDGDYHHDHVDGSDGHTHDDADRHHDHDEHNGTDDDHHDGHNEHNGTDDDHHDGHEGHEHAEAEETIPNPVGCPVDTIISIFHMEEGEYVIEFESEHDEEFNMAALKMPGGHAHHHHGHGEEMCHNTEIHENYESTEEDCEAAGHMWNGDDDHGDTHEGQCHNTTTHQNYESTEEDCEAAGHSWIEEEGHDENGHEEDGHEEDGHDLPEIHAEKLAHSLSFPEGDHDDHDEPMTPEHAIESFDVDNDNHISWDEFWNSWGEDDH